MPVRLRTFAQRRDRPAADRHRRRRLPAGQRHAVGERGRRAAGQRRQALIQLLVKGDEPLAVVACRRQRELCGEDTAWFESRLDLLQPGEAREQQPDGDQQHERERDFGDEQAGSQTAAGSDRSASRFLQRFLHVHTRRLPRGQQADRQSGDERHGQREAERQRIDPDLDRARNEIGAKGDQRGKRPLRQQQAHRAAEDGEEHAFGDELADHVEPGRAEREARRDLPPPAGKAREHEVGDVRARNQEHTSHGAEEQQITLSLLPDRIVQERHDLDLRRRVDVGGVRGAVIGGDDVHRFARLRQRHARPQPRGGLKEEAAAVQLRLSQNTRDPQCVRQALMIDGADDRGKADAVRGRILFQPLDQLAPRLDRRVRLHRDADVLAVHNHHRCHIG